MSFINQLEHFTPSVRGNTAVDVGLNRVRLYWPERYYCLIGMKWYWCPYEEVCGGFAAINGTEILVNPKGMKRIENSDDAVGYAGFLWVHEGGHKFGNHSYHFKDLHDPETKNMAMDYHLNYVIELRNLLLEPKIGFKPFPLIGFDDEVGKVNICHDMELAEGKTIRTIYQILAKDEMKQDPPPSNPAPQDGDDSGDPDDGAGGQSQPQDGDDGDKQGDQQGDQQGADMAEEAGANQTERSKSTLGGNVLEPRIPEGSTLEEEKKKAKRQTESVILTSKIEEQSGETILAGVAARSVEVGQLTGDPVPWEQLLADKLDSMKDPSWFSPFNHDVFVTTGLLSDSRDKPSFGVAACAFDLSGSLSEQEQRNQLARFADFCATIQFEKLYLIPIDDAVGEVLELNYGDPFPDKLTAKGCGGTQLDKVFAHLEEEQIDQEISVLFFFTDGETNWDAMPQDEPDDYKVIWLDYGSDPDQYIWGERLTVDVA